jgi:hypothetical protein
MLAIEWRIRYLRVYIDPWPLHVLQVGCVLAVEWRIHAGLRVRVYINP